MTNPWDKYRGAHNPIPPLCTRCEKDWGCGPGGWGDLNRDRRLIRQVSALARVIEVTAYCRQNGHRDPYGTA